MVSVHKYAGKQLQEIRNSKYIGQRANKANRKSKKRNVALVTGGQSYRIRKRNTRNLGSINIA